MPLVQQSIKDHFKKPARKGVHPDECVALGAALLGDSLGQIDSVTLIDALSMPIGYALPSGRFRKIVEKNHVIPTVKSFRLPPPAGPGAQFIELDIFQGDSEQIVDNEYLGTVRIPASAVGKRVDFKIDEECLLHVLVEEVGDPGEVKLSTRDTPETLKRALAEEMALRLPTEDRTAAEKGGLFSSLKRLLGG